MFLRGMWHAMHAPAGPSGLWCECSASDSGVAREVWHGKQTLFPAGVARAARCSGWSGAWGSWHPVHGRLRAGPPSKKSRASPEVVAERTIAYNSRQLRARYARSPGSLPGKFMDSLVPIG